MEGHKYTNRSRKQASNAAVVASVAQEEGAIGYVGLAYVDETVKALDIATGAGSEPVAATLENAASKKYPLTRPLNMYTAGEPGKLARAFLDFAMSKEGQALIREVGYVPIQ